VAKQEGEVCELAHPNADWAAYDALPTDGDIAAAEGDLVVLSEAALHLQEVEDGKVKTQDLHNFILLYAILNQSARFLLLLTSSISYACYFAIFHYLLRP
jgi:hypothetical protein